MFDIVIKNGMIADGTGAALRQAAVYVKGEKIALISEDQDLPAATVVDAAGRIVAPGFIDMHTHSDTAPWKFPGFEGRLHQGVTTDLAGNCGGSFVPRKKEAEDLIPIESMKEMIADLSGKAFAGNFNTFIGHGDLRTCCMANRYAEVPTPEELEAMKALLDKELTDGALGMSIGLVYMPGVYCKTEELIELAKVVKKHNKLCPIHMRSESDKIWEALDEVHRIAKESGVHMHISHFKLMYEPQWHQADRLIARVGEMRADGCEVTCDQYPYLASSTGLKGILPNWAKQGKGPEIAARLADEELWEKIRPALAARMASCGGADKLVAAVTYDRMPEVDGKSLKEIGEMFGLDPVDAYRKIMIRCEGTIAGIYHAMCKEDTLKVMAREDIAVISDSGVRDFVTGARVGKPHPRSTSSAVKFLRLVREEKLMPIEKAVAKLTGVPANIVGLSARGFLKTGYQADIVIFDPETVADRGTFEDPFQTAVGIDAVYVNGVLTWTPEGPTGAKAGQLVFQK